MNNCKVSELLHRHEMITIKPNTKKKYAVPKSLIPTVLDYDTFNPLQIAKNVHAIIRECDNRVLVQLFKLKLFKTQEKAVDYAKKKGHNIVYEL